jgi:cysteine dioxygenase
MRADLAHDARMVLRLRDRILEAGGAERPLTAGEMTSLARETDLSALDLGRYCSFKRDCYTRNTVLLNDNLELVVICWLAGQASAIHDHGDSRCLYLVVDGEMKEERFRVEGDAEPEPVDVRTFGRGDVTLALGSDVHRIRNDTAQNLTTVHIYSPPLANTRMFTPIPRST